MKLIGTILRCLARKVNSGNKETYRHQSAGFGPWHRHEPCDRGLGRQAPRPAAYVRRFAVIGVVNKNTSGIPAFRAIIGPPSEAEEAPLRRRWLPEPQAGAVNLRRDKPPENWALC